MDGKKSSDEKAFPKKWAYLDELILLKKKLIKKVQVVTKLQCGGKKKISPHVGWCETSFFKG